MRANRTATALCRMACLAGVMSLAVVSHAQVQAASHGSEKEASMKMATSRDGTRIAYDTSGQGAALILVNGALSARSSNAELAKLLAPHFTVLSYDRRGRGDSTDTRPYSVQREVEDLAALVEAAGGSVYLYGKSSGAALALAAASSLGDKVRKLAIYEAPYDEAEGAASAWRTFRSELDALLAADRREDAVAFFMQFVGASAEAIEGMKASPAWPGMVAMAPTLAHDNAVLGEDRSVPVEIAAKVKARTLVMDGGASAEAMPFMRPTADKLAKVIPDARRRTVDGQAHDVDAKALAPILVEFFQ